jgi:DNA-directed RNA polymerase subunit RPC12/RpoP
MRILVLTEEGDGTTRLREQREVFGVNEFRLSYTCVKCRTEFLFRADDSGPRIKWFDCPVCQQKLEMSEGSKNRAVPNPDDVYLWEALSLYRKFYSFADAHELPLKLVVTVPGPSKSAASGPAPNLV